MSPSRHLDYENSKLASHTILKRKKININEKREY